MAAFYCAVCRQTFFSGKKHIFGKGHQSRLRVVLLKFLDKVREARRTLKEPQVVKFDPTEHSRTFWCYCCGLETPRNVTDGNMTVLHGGLLEHMATAEHARNTNRFWWEYKADPKLKDKVIISMEETERFKAEVRKALESYVEKEDEFVKQQAAIIRSQENHRREVLASLMEVGFPWCHGTFLYKLLTFLNKHQPEVEQELSNGCCSEEVSVEKSVSSHFRSLGADQQVGPRWGDPMTEGQWAGQGPGLTFIGYQDSSNGGNVHTGAVPPWLQDDPLEGGSGGPAQEVGPSFQDFLKHKEQVKLRKLPPNRVGANFDHSSQTDADWLPSFGRVWNSGRRWQSRNQFREEESKDKRHKRTRESGPGGSKRQKPSP